MTKIVNGGHAPFHPSGVPRRLNLKYFNICLFILIAIGGFFYLVNISDLTVQSFALRDLKSQAAFLASAKAENEEKANAIQSYYTLNERTQELNMIAVGNVEYLAANHSTVAKK